MHELNAKKRAWKLPCCFAIGSLIVTATATALACSIWSSLRTIPPGTAVRPMFEAACSMLVGGAGTAIGLGLAAGCIAFGRHRIPLLVLGGLAGLLALTPVPAAMIYSDWVMQSQGLIPAP